MLVVIPVCEKDSFLALRNLDWCITMDSRVDFPALVCHERGFDPTPIVELARRYFLSVDIYEYDKWTGDPNWPQPQNFCWQMVARHVEMLWTKSLSGNALPERARPWFWWEQDAVPLKLGWLSTLAAAHQQGERPFSGAVAQQLGNTYMAGVGVYPPNLSKYCRNALLTRSQPWDMMMSTRDGTLRLTHDISPLICHTPLIQNTHFESREDVAQLIPESAVLFHKCKDGSLLDVLQGRADAQAIGSRLPISPIQAMPSFTEQTRWESGYFTFPAATNTVYFNCSILEVNGQLHLFTRRWRYQLEQITGGAMQGNQSDLAIWKIRPNMSLHPQPLLPSLPQRYPYEQWEDPRTILGEDGLVYMSFATWVHRKPWTVRQSFARLSPDWRKVEHLWEAPYGGNQRRPDAGKLHEKNWIWFQHDSRWLCQYSINPGDVFMVDGQGNPTQYWQTKESKHEWEHGLPLRGGTTPVRIGDEYWAFFHTSTVWQKPKRRYYMGAYVFDAEPPFALKRITPRPILTGSEHDFRALGGPLVIFPCGAHYDNGEWLVVFGVNDEACGWIKIPHIELEDQTVEVKRGIMEKFMGAFA